MFKNIIVALDGSPDSKGTLPVAAELAKASGAKLVIAHVIEKYVGKGGAGPINVKEDEILADIEGEAKKLSDQGIETSIETADVVSMIGGPAKGIAEIADKVNADLIVAGRRGHNPLTGLLLGSVTQRLLQIADQPVLVIPQPDAA
jgi:nucleotide-binding universal stress UspA family protein